MWSTLQDESQSKYLLQPDVPRVERDFTRVVAPDNIATGYGVKKVPQKDIVFLVCDALEIVNAGIPYCFTDGNATKAISKFYNTLYGLRELDWPCIHATIWKNTEDDYDRVRKKMSEFPV